jgi:hypothetical protein
MAVLSLVGGFVRMRWHAGYHTAIAALHGTDKYQQLDWVKVLVAQVFNL